MARSKRKEKRGLNGKEKIKHVERRGKKEERGAKARQ